MPSWRAYCIGWYLIGNWNRVLTPSGLNLGFSLFSCFYGFRREKTDQIICIGCEWILIVLLLSSTQVFFVILESVSRWVCSAVAVFGFYQIIQGGQVGKGKEEFICRKRLLCLLPPIRSRFRFSLFPFLFFCSFPARSRQPITYFMWCPERM